MNPLILLGIGALFIFASQSKSSSTSEKKDQDGISKLPGKVSDVPDGSIPKTGSGGISVSKCLQNQYRKNDKCITFWSANIEKQVSEKLKQKVDYFTASSLSSYSKLGLPHPITVLCIDISKDPAFTIIKETMNEIWPDTKNAILPPVQTSPFWVKTIWNKILDKFKKEICGK